MSRLKVCHVQVLPLMSGVQRAMLAFFEVLPADRYEVVVICQAEGPLTETLRAHGIRYILMPELVRPVRPWKDVQALIAFCHFCYTEKPDVLHLHSSKPGVLGRLAGTLMQVPVVIQHNHGYAWTKSDPAFKKSCIAALERTLTRACDMVIFVSEETRRFSVARGLVPEHKSYTIYNGVDTTHHRPPHDVAEVAALRAARGIPTDAFLLTFVGRLWEQKNPLALPEIFETASRLAPERNIHLAIAGEGHLEAKLRDALQARGLLERTHFLGWVSDAAPVYRMSDCLILPSLFEGLPLVLEECMASGLPAVCSKIPGSREVVTPEVGFAEPLTELARMGERVAQLANDATLCASMRAQARAKALAQFDRNVTLPKLPPLYARLLAQSAVAGSTAIPRSM